MLLLRVVNDSLSDQPCVVLAWCSRKPMLTTFDGKDLPKKFEDSRHGSARCSADPKFRALLYPPLCSGFAERFNQRACAMSLLVTAPYCQWSHVSCWIWPLDLMIWRLNRLAILVTWMCDLLLIYGGSTIEQAGHSPFSQLKWCNMKLFVVR